MTPKLYLAANLIPQTLVFGHLQIVYETANGDLLENETTSPEFPYFFGDWAYPEFDRPHDNTTNTPGYGNPQDYSIVALDLRPEQTAEYVWELMEQIHASLAAVGHGLDYDIQQNSNSYIMSVLWAVGIDIGQYLAAVTPPDVSSFPGVWTNIFLGAKTGGLFSGYDTPIPLNIAGTAGHDYLMTGMGDDTLGGAAGNDEIHAGDGADTVEGGDGDDLLFGEGGRDLLCGGAGRDLLCGDGGNDTLFGDSGRDTLIGGKGFDEINGGTGRDRLKGGNGNDLLRGEGGHDNLFGNVGNDTLLGGAGNDRLTGGKNADTFVFVDGFGTDTLVDFDATDDAEKIDLSGVASITDFADLIDPTNPHMTQVGADVVIDDFAGNTITLLNTTLGDLDANDFIF